MQQETMVYLDQTVKGLQAVARLVRSDTDDVVRSGDHVQVIIHFDQVRKATNTIKEAREALNEIEDRLSKEWVPDVMRAHKIKTTTIEGVGRVTISNRFSCSMLDKTLGFEWLRAEGHGGLITETVNAQTLAAFAKNLLEDEGKELPAELFKVGTQSFTSITKVK